MSLNSPFFGEGNLDLFLCQLRHVYRRNCGIVLVEWKVVSGDW